MISILPRVSLHLFRSSQERRCSHLTENHELLLTSFVLVCTVLTMPLAFLFGMCALRAFSYRWETCRWILSMLSCSTWITFLDHWELRCMLFVDNSGFCPSAVRERRPMLLVGFWLFRLTVSPNPRSLCTLPKPQNPQPWSLWGLQVNLTAKTYSFVGFRILGLVWGS